MSIIETIENIRLSLTIARMHLARIDAMLECGETLPLSSSDLEFIEEPLELRDGTPVPDTLPDGAPPTPLTIPPAPRVPHCTGCLRPL